MVAAGAVLALGAAGAGAWFLTRPGTPVGLGAADRAASGAARAAANPGLSKTVVATIDGRPVVEAELANLLATGADRAVAIDRYINKVLVAEAGRSRYAEEARTLVAAAEREVLSNLYLQRRAQEISQSVTDEQVADFYKANVRDEDYTLYKLRYYLSRDQNDAANVRALIEKGDKAAVAKLAPLARAEDNFLPFRDIPYDLGQVVRRAKAGDIIGPVVVRDGVLLLVLDDTRTGKKPELAAVKDQIRATLADRQLTEEILGLRKKASIQLN